MQKWCQKSSRMPRSWDIEVFTILQLGQKSKCQDSELTCSKTVKFTFFELVRILAFTLFKLLAVQKMKVQIYDLKKSLNPGTLFKNWFKCVQLTLSDQNVRSEFHASFFDLCFLFKYIHFTVSDQKKWFRKWEWPFLYFYISLAKSLATHDRKVHCSK